MLICADELLQEQKADMDQFLSSISESQPDVTVSSEESVEVPVSEVKPYRPFQVTSLGSRPEPEGESPQLQDLSPVESRYCYYIILLVCTRLKLKTIQKLVISHQ